MNRFFLKYQKAIIWTVVIGFLLGGIGLFTFQRFAPPRRGSEEEVVLIVGGHKFTRQDLNNAYENLVQYYTQLYQAFGQDFRRQLEGTDGAFMQQSLRASAAESLIRQSIIESQARSLHISVPKAELEKAVEKRYQDVLKQFNGSEEDLKKYLATLNLTLDQYLAQLRASERGRLLEEALHKEVVGPIEPTEEELAAYYQEHQDRYQSEPEKIRVAYIEVPEAKLADELLPQAKKEGADFSALAEAHADQGVKSGETDWFSEGGSDLPGKVEDAAFALKEGDVTLVDADGKYYIVKLLGRKPPVIPPLEEIRDKVEKDYINDEDQKRWNDWYRKAREAAKIEIKDPLLEAFIVYRDNPQKALDILLDAKATGAISDLYLDYYIGRIYERLYSDLGSQIADLEKKENPTDEDKARLSELKDEEKAYKDKAVRAYLDFLETGQGDERFFTRLLALDPRNPEVHYRLAELYRERGQYIQADREYQQAIEAKPDFVAAYIGQGDADMAAGLFGHAIEVYKKALSLQTGSRAIELRLAQAYVRDSEYDTALPLVEKLLEQDPEDPDVEVLMGDLLLGQGKAAQAAEYYEKALDRKPGSDIQLKLGQAYLAAGDLDKAEEEFQDLVQRFPYRGAAYEGLGDVYRARGKADRALEEYREALRRTYEVERKEAIAEKIVALDPDDIETRFKLADYYRQEYKYDAAIKQYLAILERQPENADALIGLGDCYVPKTDYDRALSYYRKALEHLTNPARKLQVYDKIVNCESQRVGTAGKLTQAALEALWNEALIYKQQGKNDQAKAALQKIYDTDPTFHADELIPWLKELGGSVQTPPATLEGGGEQTGSSTSQ